jgi:hypothetical protein
VTTLRFGPTEAASKHDLTDEWAYNEHLEDVNLDGHMDLMLHFKTQETGIVCGDTEAMLTGGLLDGMPFEGTDAFETVGCNSNRPPRGGTSRDTERMRRQQSPTNGEEQQPPRRFSEGAESRLTLGKKCANRRQASRSEIAIGFAVSMYRCVVLRRRG